MIHITSAQSAESPLLLSLIVQGFEQYRDKLDPPSGVFAETAETIAKKIDQGGGFIAWEGDTPVGAVLYENEPDAVYLGRLSVLPAHRGKGIASLLVTAVEDATRLQGVNRVWLGVRVALTGNQAFFEGLGYAIYESDRHEGYAEPTFVRMQKFLSI